MKFDNQVIKEIENIYDIHVDKDLIKKKLKSKKEKETVEDLKKVKHTNLLDIFKLDDKTQYNIILGQEDLQRKLGKKVIRDLLMIDYDSENDITTILTNNPKEMKRIKDNFPSECITFHDYVEADNDTYFGVLSLKIKGKYVSYRKPYSKEEIEQRKERMNYAREYKETKGEY